MFNCNSNTTKDEHCQHPTYKGRVQHEDHVHELCGTHFKMDVDHLTFWNCDTARKLPNTERLAQTQEVLPLPDTDRLAHVAQLREQMDNIPSQLDTPAARLVRARREITTREPVVFCHRKYCKNTTNVRGFFCCGEHDDCPHD